MLQLILTKIDILSMIGDPNEKIISLKSFLMKLLQAPKVNQELVYFGMKILNALISPGTIQMLRKMQTMELLIGFLVRNLIEPAVILEILNVRN